jgi:lipoate---protein ligase
MRLLDQTLESPALNLAFEEVLLFGLESGRTEETLRFWESPDPFVVLGVGQAVREEVRVEACQADNIPILRRASAGGCVLQGPGCLNFTLALSLESHGEARDLHASYKYILGPIAKALEKRGLPASREGVCDLSIDGLKVSGNAQKRRKRAILHHGSLLYAMDLDAIPRYLREPAKRPEYRGDRTHDRFVKNLPLSAQALRDAVCEAFEVSDPPSAAGSWELETARQLADEKYSAAEWTWRR